MTKGRVDTGANDKGQGGHWGKMTKGRVDTAGLGQNDEGQDGDWRTGAN